METIWVARVSRVRDQKFNTEKIKIPNVVCDSSPLCSRRLHDPTDLSIPRLGPSDFSPIIPILPLILCFPK